MVPGGQRKILDINAPKRDRLKPGAYPKPKPAPFLVNPAEYVPAPSKKPKTRYTNEQIIEVLQFLYYHRILDKVPDGRQGEKMPRYRSGTILQKEPDRFKAPNGQRYRSPTYEEAAEWFQIPKSTVATWWNTKLELIGIKPEPAPPQAPMPDFLLMPRASSSAQAAPNGKSQSMPNPPSPHHRLPQGGTVVPGSPDSTLAMANPPQESRMPPQGMHNPHGALRPLQGVRIPPQYPPIHGSGQQLADPVFQLASVGTPSMPKGPLCNPYQSAFDPNGQAPMASEERATSSQQSLMPSRSDQSTEGERCYAAFQ